MTRPKLNKAIMKLLHEAHIKHNEKFCYKKVQFYPMFEDYSPETIGRTLRDLADKQLIEVSYYDGKYAKNLARYKLK